MSTLDVDKLLAVANDSRAMALFHAVSDQDALNFMSISSAAYQTVALYLLKHLTLQQLKLNRQQIEQQYKNATKKY